MARMTGMIVKLTGTTETMTVMTEITELILG